MTLPSHPSSSGTTRLHARSSSSPSLLKTLRARRIAICYTIFFVFLFMWSASYLQHSLQLDYEVKQPIPRTRGSNKKNNKKRHDLLSKLPLWNPQQHPSPYIALTGSYRFVGPDCHTKQQQEQDDCLTGRLHFPAVDLKNALPYDEAVDLLTGINRNTTIQSSVVANNRHAPTNLAVLTRGGNKDFAASGSVTANQDRILILEKKINYDFILGLFDGHGTDGHVVSHHAALHLAPMLHQHLQQKSTQEALTDTILEIEETLPANTDPGSGSTGIVVYRQDDSLFIANTGDSFCFVASYDSTSGKTEFIYQTKPHKPNLPEERKRIEAAGGQVIEPQGPGDSSRVLIPMSHDDDNEQQEQMDGLVMALAMSRSIGDKQAIPLGVIANPTIDVLNLKSVAIGKQLFVVAASDGLFDKVPATQVAETLAASLFESSKPPLEACEELIMQSSLGWIANGMPYRDDISVATMALARG